MIPDASVAYAKQWGMNTEIQDLRRVVSAPEAARRSGGKVVVGGHSLGGTITSAYATWDFGGRAGADGLAGLLFIDGGCGPTPVTPAAARDSLSRLDAASASPWLQFGGIPAPFTGLFNSTGSLGVLLDPDAPSLGQASGLLPANIVPPQPVTNAGQYGYALDVKTSPPALAAAQAHLGHARDRQPGGLGRRRRADAAQAHGRRLLRLGPEGPGRHRVVPPAAADDRRGRGRGRQQRTRRRRCSTSTRRTAGTCRATSRCTPSAPRWAAQRVLDATKALARQSHIPTKNLTLVDRHTTYAHNDPNTADPSKNDFLKRLVPWLKSVAK